MTDRFHKFQPSIGRCYCKPTVYYCCCHCYSLILYLFIQWEIFEGLQRHCWDGYVERFHSYLTERLGQCCKLPRKDHVDTPIKTNLALFYFAIRRQYSADFWRSQKQTENCHRATETPANCNQQHVCSVNACNLMHTPSSEHRQTGS